MTKREYIDKTITLTAWERGMIRGMIAKLRASQKLSDNEQQWVAEMEAKVKD